jgi:hypothetical protein
MRALNQFKSLFAKMTDGIAGVRPSPGLNRAGGGPNAQRDPALDAQRAASATQVTHNDENRAQPSSGSYPAVWPR